MIALYINGVLADLNSNGVDISLNRELTNAQDFNARSGDFSLTLSLPKTKTNNRIFENANEVHQVDKFRRATDFNAELFANGENILTGFIKLSGVDSRNYKGNLYGDSISWADLLDSINLRDLNWAIPYLGPGVAVGEIDYYNNLIDSPIRFPLIAYFPLPNTNPASASNELTATTLYDVAQLPPEVSAIETIRRCFKTIGWEVSGSFFASPAFKSLYLPYVGESYPPLNYARLGGFFGGSGGTETITFANVSPPDPFAGVGVPDGYEWLKLHGTAALTPLISELVTVTNAPSGTGGRTTFRTRYAGRFMFDIELKNIVYTKAQLYAPPSFPIVPTGKISLWLADYNDPETTPFSSIDQYNEGLITEIDSGGLLGFYDFDSDYNAENRDGLKAEVLENNYTSITTPGPVYNISGSGNIKVRFTVDLAANAEIDFLLVAQLYEGFSSASFTYDAVFRVNQVYPFDLHPAQLLPDISAKEYIKAFITKFNLWFSTNGKTISFFDFDTFFRPDLNAVNIDEVGNILASDISPMQSNSRVEFNYQDDKEDRIISGTDIGNETVISKNVYSQGDKTIKSIFAITSFLFAGDIVAGKTFKIPIIQTSDTLEQDPTTAAFITEFAPRLLQWVGVLSGSSFPMIKQSGTVAVSVGLNTFNGSPPAPEFISTGFNLNYNNSPGLADGIVKRYWVGFLSLLDRSHSIEIKAIIPPALYRAMQIDTPIIFDSEIWYLSEINGYNPLDGGATITLIKKVF